MPARSAYTLTGQLTYASSPLRRYLDQTFPNRRDVFRTWPQTPVGTYVEGDPKIAGVVGAAFDLCMRATLDPLSIFDVPWPDNLGHALAPAVHVQLVTALHKASDGLASGVWAETAGRAAWAVARFIEVYRTGPQVLGFSELTPLLSEGVTRVEPYLQLARADGLVQLEQLWLLAQRELVPALERPITTELALETAKWCAAEIDLFAGGSLIDLKVRAVKATPGGYTDALSLQDVYQLLAYALFDRRNKHGIERVGLYSGRVGQLWTMGLQELVDRLAGRAVDLAAERKATWDAVRAA